MKFSLLTLLCALVTAPVTAFINPSVSAAPASKTSLEAERSNINNAFTTFCTTAALSAFLWGSPGMIAEQATMHQLPFGMNQVLEHNVVASAKDKASATGSRVNKDADSLLRLGLPINSKEVRELQSNLEGIKQDVTSKRKGQAIDGSKKVKSILAGKKAGKMAAVCRDSNVCTEIMKEIDGMMDPLAATVKTSQDAFTGSLEERDANVKAAKIQESAAKLLTKLEEQMVPAGYKTPVPDIYADLPQLEQRATVEMVIKKSTPDGKFDINGVNFPEARMKMVIDGYTSPITGGNFVELVSKGFYDNMAIQRSDGFVVQTGDPDGEAVGYTGGKAGKAIGQGPKGERLIPCEISIVGDKIPVYETTIEDEGRGGEATILPFSSYGAMGWARDEYDPNSGSSQFFWLLFDSDLTPAGKNVLDGRYPCFGYVVEGSDFLQDVREGDIIVSAKVTEGLQYLKEGVK